MRKTSIFHFILIAFFVLGCSPSEKKKLTKDENIKPFFVLQNPDSTSVTFRNRVKENDQVNYLSYEGVYNGAGVAIGDINNDGFADIYFGGNDAADKLYLNKGDFKFEDISNTFGIIEHTDGWSTGINMVDINADGWLDIYVCRSGPHPEIEKRTNKLFINNGGKGFTESAEEYGLNSSDYSRHSVFFDYDLDGDLDMYLMNQPEAGFKPGEFYSYLERIRNNELYTDRFFENVNGKFIDKTVEARLTSFGYGHNIIASDINNDGFPDLHKTNDFDDPDYLFINKGNKTFENKINEYFKHISWSSMGNDIADFNNDGLLDVMVLEMAPDDHVRSKTNMKAMDPIKFNALADNGQQYQYMFNTLQMNQGNNVFSDVAQIAGIAKTDWSWACLFFDVDNDGYKDLFISNGIKKDFANRDLGDNSRKKVEELGRGITISEFNNLIPETISQNLLYQNTADLKFKKQTKKWMDKSSFNSNGVALGDLDNDGDLDMVTNNMEDIASIYQNNANNGLGGNYLHIELFGPENNPFALGTRVEFEIDNEVFVQELTNTRGYLSSMNYELVFGLGQEELIEEIKIRWPDNKVSIVQNIKANQSYTFSYDALDKTEYVQAETEKTYLEKIDPKQIGIDFVHHENDHNDYKKQVLLPYAQSTHGPFITKGDVNNDGLEDLFIGGAKDQAGALYLQNSNGTFKKSLQAAFENSAQYEDLGLLLFDADQDEDLDLYVVSGGTEHQENHLNYQDRLYINDGNGNFTYSPASLPRFTTSTQTVKASDIDGDGDMDLFVGGRVIPEKYPYPPSSHILRNDDGKFIDITSEAAPYLQNLSMVSDAEFMDYDNDGDEDLITVGEWSKINIHRNNNGNFELVEKNEIAATTGLWFSINKMDVDADGDLDMVVGNLGLNSKFKADEDHEFHVFCDDFDSNGTYDIILSSNYNGELVPVRGRECSSEQLPYIKDRFQSFQSFAEADLEDIIGGNNLKNALHYEIDLFQSVWLENDGAGNFQINMLPNRAQLGPLQDAQMIDIDEDGIKELITLGNHYNVENETVRFDSSVGAVMKVENGLQPIDPTKTGLYAGGDAKHSVVIGNYLIITNNNSAPNVFKIK